MKDIDVCKRTRCRSCLHIDFLVVVRNEKQHIAATFTVDSEDGQMTVHSDTKSGHDLQKHFTKTLKEP